MKPQILIPDINATEQVDLIELFIEYGAKVAREILETSRDEDVRGVYRQQLEDAEMMLAKYTPEPDAVKITVGYVPSRKVTELRNREIVRTQGRSPDDPLTMELLEGSAEESREWVRWGVKDHTGFPYPFTKQSERCGGKNHDIVSDDCLELYERVGVYLDYSGNRGTFIFHAIADAVKRFNHLEPKKKISSPRTSSDETETLIAADAEETNIGSG